MRRINLQAKLLLAFSVILIVAVLVVTLCFYQYIFTDIERDYYSSVTDLAGSVSGQLDTEVQSLDRIALGIIYNKEMISLLTQIQNSVGRSTASQRQSLSYEFQKLLDSLIFTLNTPALTSPMISVTLPEYQMFFAWSMSGTDPNHARQALQSLEWQQRAHAAEGARILLPSRNSEWSKKEERVFSVARAIMTPQGERLGFIEVQQRFAVIEQICHVDNDSYLIVVQDDDGRPYYPFGQEQTAIPADRLAEIGTASEVTMQDIVYACASARSDYTGLTTTVLRAKSDIYQSAADLLKVTLYAIIMVLVLAMGAVIISIRSLTNPLRALRATMEQIDVGRFDFTPDVNRSNDEIYLLNTAFERMLERIDQSVRQTVQAQREEARAYLMALQSQMNPHFLYNTLNTIVVLADENGQERIAQTSSHLIDMLRYVSDYDHAKVSVQEELTHVRSYLALLETRFEDAISFTIHTSGDVDTVTVPKLILQPLVENSYKHGLTAVAPPWHVDINVSALPDGGLVMSVSDNGGGFSPEAVAEIERRIESFRVSDNLLLEIKNISLDRVGLFNTYARLCLEYGSRVHLTIDGRTPHGSVVTITIDAAEVDN